MLRTGPRNLITDVDGILVGNSEDRGLRSGVSVVVCETPSVASVDVRGGAPGTRDTDLLGSVVAASIGSMRFASAAARRTAYRGRWRDEVDAPSVVGGVAIADVVVPIVPTAILFDLLNAATGLELAAYRELAYEAAGNATPSRTRQYRRRAGRQGGQSQGRARQRFGGRSAHRPAGRRPGRGERAGYTTMATCRNSGVGARAAGEFGGLPPPQKGLGLGCRMRGMTSSHDPADGGAQRSARQHHHCRWWRRMRGSTRLPLSGSR